MSESQVVQSCIQWLLMKGCFIWRNNTGAHKTEAGHYVRFGLKGSPDIIGMTKRGQFVGVEAKYGKNTLSPEQQVFGAKSKEHNGIYIVAYSTDDLEKNKELFA